MGYMLEVEMASLEAPNIKKYSDLEYIGYDGPDDARCYEERGNENNFVKVIRESLVLTDNLSLTISKDGQIAYAHCSNLGTLGNAIRYALPVGARWSEDGELFRKDEEYAVKG